jgi:hypothetical protein
MRARQTLVEIRLSAELFMRVTRVSVDTQAIIEAMKAAAR